jgi:copper oxidase (laccase) domain-containing protein
MPSKRKIRGSLCPAALGHCQFDLPAYVAHRLQAAGVGLVEDLGEDTYAQPGRFFSYRRATHLSQPTNGRQISIVGLPA